MMMDPALQLAVEQSIDALCFYNTHVVDVDFRAHAKTALDTIHSLQSEQQQRIDSTYNGTALSPDQIADQLDELYRADAQSITSTTAATTSTAGSSSSAAATANGGNVVDAMSPVTARIFKREMKVRIHEWEASFRAMYGRDATPVDKASLRGIYELYKTVKVRVQQDEEARKNGGQPLPSSATAAAAAAAAPQPNPAGPSPQPQPPAVEKKPSQPAPVEVVQAQPQPPSQPRPTPQEPTTSGPGSGSARATTAAASASGGGSHDYPALIAEKKALKRKLHQFEDEFKKQHGRVPTKEDRRQVGRDYHRYGELKAILAQQDGGGD